jgi:predicted DNA binding CopG/RHH family protein
MVNVSLSIDKLLKKYFLRRSLRGGGLSMEKQRGKMAEHATGNTEHGESLSEDSTDYIDWTKPYRLSFPDQGPSYKTISIRLPEPMLKRIKAMARECDVPYQSLIKMILAERITIC